MPKIDLAAAKRHLKVDWDEEDALIGVYLPAAYRAVEGTIFCKVLDEDPPEPATPEELVPHGPSAGVVWAWPDINAAALLILGHLYANREDVVQGQAVAVPMGAQWLLTQYVDTAGGY